MSSFSSRAGWKRAARIASCMQRCVGCLLCVGDWQVCQNLENHQSVAHALTGRRAVCFLVFYLEMVSLPLPAPRYVYPWCLCYGRTPLHHNPYTLQGTESNAPKNDASNRYWRSYATNASCTHPANDETTSPPPPPAAPVARRRLQHIRIKPEWSRLE